jgi:hypothetical protein
MIQIKICEGCKKAFKPQMSDSDWRYLKFDDDEIMQAEMFAKESIGGFVEWGTPTQVICDSCVYKYEYVRVGFSIVLKKKEKVKKKNLTSKK